MGPLTGVRVVEMSGIGPAPFCGMLLADLGAEVIRVDRLVAADLGLNIEVKYDLLNRSKHAVAVDLKAPAGVALVKDLIRQADILIEGFRPGVMERLGLGPEVCHAFNPKLVFGRMTGWGQSGPLSTLAGHDINYISLTGVLASIGEQDKPPAIPLNLIGDFGGGALYLAFGVLAAVIEARQSGRGQVVDAAMVDGSASLMAMQFGLLASGFWRNQRGTNALDGGAPYYCAYRTRDGHYMAVGAIEKRFYAELLARLGLADEALPDQNDRAAWPVLRARFTEVFAQKTRAEWAAIFDGSDACTSPILDMEDCAAHPHLQARGTFIERDGITEPAPAPRFDRTPGAIRHPPRDPREDTQDALKAWGFSEQAIAAFRESRIIASPR